MIGTIKDSVAGCSENGGSVCGVRGAGCGVRDAGCRVRGADCGLRAAGSKTPKKYK